MGSPGVDEDVRAAWKTPSWEAESLGIRSEESTPVSPCSELSRTSWAGIGSASLSRRRFRLSGLTVVEAILWEDHAKQ